jgi:opacity protein-like surface antigen
MKTTPRIITALAIAGAFVTTAVQAAESGPYIRLDNGVNSISGADLRLQSNTVTLLNLFGYSAKDSQKLKFKEGYIFGGAVGYRFNESFSAEIELDHAENKVDTIGGYSVQKSAVGDFLGQSSITFKQTNLLVSGIYSPKLSETVTLNLGAGFGAQFSSANLAEGPDTVTLGGVAYTLSGKRKSDAAFLAQLKTGVSVALAKNFTFDAGYKLRFVGSTDIYEASIRSTPLNGSEKFTVDSHLNHVFSAGFTYSF